MNEVVKMFEDAKLAQQKAYAWKSKTRVGCAIEAEDGTIYTGANIEGLWATSIHAEVCAVAKMVNDGKRGIRVAIIADAKFFTPCGACLDWLMQFCDSSSSISVQNNEGQIWNFRLYELCPHYPRQ